MKCPKCGYLGFETSDRCRNCGYDFSLSAQHSTADQVTELPLRSAADPETLLGDFDLAQPSEDDSTLELPRATRSPAPAPARTNASQRRSTPSTPRVDDDALPLFAQDGDEGPSITPPPARPPLVVRRTTPEIPRDRGRARAARPAPTESPLDDVPDDERDEAPIRPDSAVRQVEGQPRPAGGGARILATIVDMLVLGAVDVAVVYLTLALAGLPTDAATRLPMLPMAAFFLILNGGYLIAFVAASGQTIGKMLAGIRVIGDDGERVDVGGAVLRAAGCALSLLSAGLGYLPAFVTSEGRALHDRMAGTRVVSAR